MLPGNFSYTERVVGIIVALSGSVLSASMGTGRKSGFLEILSGTDFSKSLGVLVQGKVTPSLLSDVLLVAESLAAVSQEDS